jgi:hypothetical protein
VERVIALDPGETTGWALYRGDAAEGTSKFTCGQIGPYEHHNELDILLGHMQGEGEYTIVCERFEYRNNSRAGLNLMSREYIGVAKRFVQERREVEYVMQSAAQAKGFVQDRHIKKLGLWSPGDKHAMDAYRHLLYYLVNTADYPIGKRLLEEAWK